MKTYRQDGKQKETSEYRTWVGMLNRCHNPNDRGYKNYGGRGITVCEQWRQSFDVFIADVGRKPTKRHSLDRVDNNQGYFPGNVRWATSKEQTRNARYNRWLEYKGERLICADWAKKCGMSPQALFRRLANKWPLHLILEVPVKKYRPRKRVSQ